MIGLIYEKNMLYLELCLISLIIMSILLYNNIRLYRISIKSHMTRALITGVVCAILDVCWAVSEMNSGLGHLSCMFACVFSLSMILNLYLIFIFVFYKIYNREVNRVGKIFILYVPFMIILGFSISSIWSDFFVSYDQDGIVVYGTGYLIYGLFFCIYILVPAIMSVIAYVRNRDNKEKRHTPGVMSVYCLILLLATFLPPLLIGIINASGSLPLALALVYLTSNINTEDAIKGREKNAMIEADMNTARNIQLGNLTNEFPEREDMNIYATMTPAKEVGGDFYDVYMLGEDKVVFLVADASGKGVPAAMLMMQAKATIKILVEEGLKAHDVFTKANERLCQGNDARMFVTAWMGMLDLSTGMMSFVNAGHNAPIYITDNGNCEYLNKKSGMVLGCMEGIKYKLYELKFNHGDRLYLYTDGVTEATDAHNEMYGDDRLIEFIGANRQLSVKETLPAIKADIDHFVDGAEQFDDITMAMFEYL